jgi:hypothetical protein
LGHLDAEYADSLRYRAAKLAEEMLADSDQLIQRCSQMWSLILEIEGDQYPQEFTIFTVVPSESDQLPIGVAPELLEAGYRERVKREEADFIKFYAASIREGCRAVLDRYLPSMQD